MMSATLTATNGHSPAVQPWLRESVQTFFEGVNWSGMVRHAAPSSGTAASPVLDTESLMTLTVGQFFEMMSWEGTPTIGVPIVPLEAPATTADTPSDDLTLDDFSSFFG